MKPVTKLILPVAGLGKRLMPLTKDTPKNLIPVNGKPLLEYALQEAVASGIREVILVVNPKNRDQFKEYIRKNAGRFPMLTFHIRVQDTLGGNGHAVLQAYDLIADEPVAIRFCDDIIWGNQPVLKSLIELFHHYKSSVVLLEQVPNKEVSRYGVAGFEKTKGSTSLFLGGRVAKINKFVEKPKIKDAPSNLMVPGGYVLIPEVLRNFKAVADVLPSVADDALPMPVALQIELIAGRTIYGWEFPGRRLDCGTLDKLRQTEAFLRKHESKPTPVSI